MKPANDNLSSNPGHPNVPATRGRFRRRLAAGAQQHPAVALGLLFLIGILFIRIPALYRDLWGEFGPPRPQLPWRRNIDRAAALSLQTGKPLLVDFNAPWCPPCRAMRRYVWSNARVQAYVKAHFIPLSASLTAPAARRLARQYNVQYIPRILVLNAHGRILLSASTMGVARTLRFLRAAAQTTRVASTSRHSHFKS